MRKYASFLTVLAVAAAPFRHGNDVAVVGRPTFDSAQVDYTMYEPQLPPGAPVGQSRRIVWTCVEINQCVGCTRQFFTKSFRGDDAAVLAPLSGEEPASPPRRRVDGVEVDAAIRAPQRGRARAPGARCNSGICGHGLGAFMEAMNVELDAFADVIDETQLSLELYFYARELNRADHMLLGLAPPGVGLLPPGEPDVFATRGEAH